MTVTLGDTPPSASPSSSPGNSTPSVSGDPFASSTTVSPTLSFGPGDGGFPTPNGHGPSFAQTANPSRATTNSTSGFDQCSSKAFLCYRGVRPEPPLQGMGPAFLQMLGYTLQAHSDSTHCDWLCQATMAVLLTVVTDGAAAEGFATADSAANAVNGVRLAQQLQAQSMFDEAGGLSAKALGNSRQIISADELGNSAIPDGFAKYLRTQLFDSPAGPGQIHFYMNPGTGEVYYDLDYQFIFQSSIGK